MQLFWVLAAAADGVEEVERVAGTAERAWATLVEALPRLGIAVVVATVVILVGKLMRRVVHWRLSKKGRTPSFVNVFSRLTQTLFTVIAVLLAITIIFPSVKPVDVLASAGLLTVAAGFAFQDVLSNLLAGILLLFRQPFIGGDQIRVGKSEGTVTEITIRETVLKSFDGRKIVIPNSKVYSEIIEVQTGFAHIRTAFAVGVAYEADLSTARQIIVGALAEVDGVISDPAPEALVKELAASTVIIEARFWSDPHQLHTRQVLDRAVEQVKRRLDEAGVELPSEILALQATSSLAAALKGEKVTPGGVVARD